MSTILIATVPACIALTNLVKQAGLPTKYLPLISIAIGIVLSLFDVVSVASGINYVTITQAVAQGLILGLGASGLYDFGTQIGSKANKDV